MQWRAEAFDYDNSVTEEFQAKSSQGLVAYTILFTQHPYPQSYFAQTVLENSEHLSVHHEPGSDFSYFGRGII
jgi:hypothetical protein